MADVTTQRPRFRFRIRDVLLVMTVLGLSLAWWNERRQVEMLKAASTEVSGVVTIDGLPLNDARIYFRRTTGEFAGCEIRNGVFTIPHVPTGSWQVQFKGDQIADMYQDGLTAEVTDKTRLMFGLKSKAALQQLSPASTNP